MTDDGYFDKNGDWVRPWRSGDMSPRAERISAWALPILFVFAIAFVVVQTLVAIHGQ